MLRTIISTVLATCLATNAIAANCAVQLGFPKPPPPISRADCPQTCVIRYNDGGNIEQFRRAGVTLKNDGRRLVIAGDCISACTVLADVARPRVCITPQARFRFHKAFLDERRLDMIGDYRRDIQAWIKRKGGLPGSDVCDDALLTMSNREARQFFPLCG